ncbi:substrate-binding domain-containing protein [Stetteria hydrogenophila]
MASWGGRTLALLATALVVLAALGAVVYSNYGHKPVRLVATTTTSLYSTGLLDYLADKFHEEHPDVTVEFIAVGSGEALRRAEMGDACMVLVHAPSLEREYMEKGVIGEGAIFAYNYFVIAGPPGDPAGVRGAGSAVGAFKAIYQAGEEGRAVFLSRGDNSGTHVRELMLWRRAGLDPSGRPWYKETGQGMAQTLVMASEMGAYTLSDIGTFLKLKKDGRIPGLEVLYSNSTELINVYSVYIVNSCKGRERKAAEEFRDFILTHQDLIEYYGVQEYGQPLFHAARGREDYLRAAWMELAGG